MRDALPEDAATLNVAFPPKVPAADYSYRRDRNYIAGVTNVLREHGMLLPDGTRVSKPSEWELDRATGTLTVKIG